MTTLIDPRALHLARLDKVRPVVVLTRTAAHLQRVTVAPITSVIRGVTTEVPVGVENGLDQEGVITCDNVVTITRSELMRQVGFLLPLQERQLVEALAFAYDLDLV